MINFGDFPTGKTLYIPFHTFSSDDPSASITITGLALADIKVYKNGGTTQRSSTSGFTLLDTDGIDFDGITGVHGISIDTSDDTDAGFYAANNEYWVVIDSITLDGATVSPLVATFSIDNRGLLRLTATAETNLESQYDGTGLTGDTFPGTQAQLSNITNVGSATNKSASSFTSTTIGSETNTYAATEALDGNYHELTDSGGTFDGYYEFLIGAGIPSSVQHTGYLTGNNDDLGMYGYDWDATAWVQIGSIQGSNSTSNAVNSFDMFVPMVGKGADFGKVRVRPYKVSGLTSATLKTDQIFIAFSQEGVSALDAVYFDSSANNTGTTNLDGVPGNPVSTEAAVNTLLASRNLYNVKVALESSLTFATSHTDEFWHGEHWHVVLGGQNLSGSHFTGADVTGTATASADPIDFAHCEIGTCTLPQFHAIHCDFSGTVTFGEAGDYHIAHSRSGIAGANTPEFDTGAAIANVNFSVGGWENGFELRNLNNAGTDLFSISGKGQIVYALSCSGTVNQRGMWQVTNTGGVTIIADDNTQGIADTLADTAEIGTAGAGLTDLGGMSTAMKAEVNAEADTANSDYGANTTVPDAAGTAPTAVENRQEMDSNSTQLAAIVADTNELQTNQGNWLTATGFFTSGTMTESYAADGAEATPEQALYQIWGMLTEFAISGTTLTVKKLDGSTTAMTFTLDDGTTPTALNRAT